MKENKKVFYDCQTLLTKDRVMCMSLGVRGIGKTYSVKKWVIKNWLKKGKQFLYLTRFKNDLPFLSNTCFDDVASDVGFEGHKIETRKLEVYVDDKLAGRIMAVSQSTKIKKTAMPLTDVIIYDEFLQETNLGGRYLKNEPWLLSSIASSVFRRRTGCRIICLGNTTELINPYFDFFGIIPDRNKEYNLYKNIVVEISDPDKYYNEETEKTDLEELLMNTEYGEYAYGGEFNDSDESLLGKMHRLHQCKYNIIFNGETFGVWIDRSDNGVLISTKFDPSVSSFTVLSDELNERGAYKGWYESRLLYVLKDARNANNIKFTDIRVKKKGIEFLKKIGIY